MLIVSNLSIHFAGRYLFDSVGFTVNKSDKIGLIGRNGTGKSTLLKIILGLELAEEGSVSKPNGYTIGYLPQEGSCDSDKCIFDEAKTALSEIGFLESTIVAINKDISSRTDYESKEYRQLVDSLKDLNDRHHIIGGSSKEATIERILLGLGFTRDDFPRIVTEFSGGWQMRLELTKILLRNPDCVLLDEPTNHLDIESVRWLENYLKSFAGAVILVSHDRHFLDKVTNRTFELSGGKIFDMPLPYSTFVEQREQLRQQQLSAYKNQQKQITQTERFIERFRSKATLATRVQSKIKQLDKIDRIELDDVDTGSIHFRFPVAPRSGLIVAEAENLSKHYGEFSVLENVNFAIERGEKIAFVGRNGEGKTTFSKIIAGEEDYEGKLTSGYNVQIGFFSQNQADTLDGNSSVFELIDNIATGEMRTRVRSLLGAFLFSGYDIYKKVKVLSGGEKSRLALARLLLQPINLLVLDEPTNHLDMVAKDVLKNALIAYQGALIVVSHDIDFLDGLTTKTIEFRNKNIHEYPGSIKEFLVKHDIENTQKLEEISLSSNREPAEDAGQAKLNREKQKSFKRDENRLRKQIEKVESEIESLEAKLEDIEVLFTDSALFSEPLRVKLLQNQYSYLKKILDSKIELWTALHEELENLKKLFNSN